MHITPSNNSNQFSAIILAAGYSSRMNGKLKALLPLESFPHLLHMVIDRFKSAGVQDIHIVLGHEHENIRKIIEDLGCCVVYNPDFAKGMYSSIYTGIQSVLNKNTTKASFILPVDAALIKASTLRIMMSAWQEFNKFDTILIPSFLKKCGHPPLVGKEHFAKIIEHYQCREEGGLRGYFASYLTPHAKDLFLEGNSPACNVSASTDTNTHTNTDANANTSTDNNKDKKADRATRNDAISDTLRDSQQVSSIINFIHITDEGILSDIDTLDDYKNAQDFLRATQNRRTASLEESWHLLQEAQLPERIATHSYHVAIGALRLGLVLQQEEINPLYLICGGLLHDICRLQKNHASVGEAFLQEMGWKDLACIVGSHTVLPRTILQAMDIHLQESIEDISIAPCEEPLHNNPACLYACICVYLADKFYSGANFVSLENRFVKVKERFKESPEALQAIDKREQVAIAVCDWFYSKTKIQAEKCVQINSNHELEVQLQALCETLLHTVSIKKTECP